MKKLNKRKKSKTVDYCAFYRKAGVCGHIAATLHQLARTKMKKETDSKGASEADIPCTSKTNSWKGRTANSNRKIQIEKVPLETYDFNKVTILGEKHRKQKSFDPDTFNPAPLENDETVRKRMVKFVSTASSNDDISFRGLFLWKLKFLK